MGQTQSNTFQTPLPLIIELELPGPRSINLLFLCQLFSFSFNFISLTPAIHLFLTWHIIVSMSSSQPHTLNSTPLPSPLSPKRSLSVTPRKVDLELARLKQLGKVTKKSDDGDGQQYQSITTADDGPTAPTSKHSTGSINKTKLIDDGLSTSDSGTEDSEEDDMERQQLILMERFERQMKEKQQQLDDLQKQIEEHNNQHEQDIQQLKDEHQQQLLEYQSQLLQQEKLAHDTMTRYMGEYESSQLKVAQLTELAEKQDVLIQLYVEQQQDHQLYQQPTPLKDQDGSMITILETDWHSLQMDKERLEAGIVALKANMETNQAHMQMMMMVSTEIQNDFEQQKVKMKKHMAMMAEELVAKNALLSHYQEQEQGQSGTTNLHTATSKRAIELHLPASPTASSSSPSPVLDDHSLIIMNNNAELPTPDISRYPSFVSSSSSSSSIGSNSPPPPPLYLSTRSSITSVPPSSPPPSTPLPPIPPPQLPSSPTASTSTSSSSSTSSLKQQQHRYQQYQQQQQSRYFYQQQQKRQPAPLTTPIHRHESPIVDPLISPTLRASSLDDLQHNGKPFWKNMKNKWRTS